jgi:hypothetical protein
LVYKIIGEILNLQLGSFIKDGGQLYEPNEEREEGSLEKLKEIEADQIELQSVEWQTRYEWESTYL